MTMVRSVGAVVSLLIIAVLFGAGAPVVGQDENIEPLNFCDVLSRDPRDSPAGCPNVDYGTAAAGNEARRIDPNRDGPTRVDVSLFVLAVDRIDPLSNSFHFEGYGGLTWCDPRQAFDAVEAGQDVLRLEEEGEMNRRLGGMWWPGIILPTQLGESERSFRRLDILFIFFLEVVI